MKSFRKSDNESLIRLTVLAKVKDEKKVLGAEKKIRKISKSSNSTKAEHGLINANKERPVTQ